MANSSKVFLSAKWLDLVFLNYVIDPALLLPLVPPGTTLDSFDGNTYVSLVGFRFCDTKLWGKISIPFHSEFEEVNLRFYVRREFANELRRGVVFIKEIVPKAAIALTARLVYGENYVALPMTHKVASIAGAREVEYAWTHRGHRSRLLARTSGSPQPAVENSLEQYITEHYWGYSRQKSGQSLEYQVTHQPWHVQIASKARFEGNAASLYGPEMAVVLSRPPDSAHFAEGSPIAVHAGARI
jgi:uncharacterized protein YqjF (DUF2071 family)